MPVPSASEPHLSLHRALMTDDERIIKMEDYAQQHRVFQTFEVKYDDRTSGRFLQMSRRDAGAV